MTKENHYHCKDCGGLLKEIDKVFLIGAWDGLYRVIFSCLVCETYFILDQRNDDRVLPLKVDYGV